MKSNFKPITILVLIAVVLPELLTGSSSISTFLSPSHLIILFFGYGLPVLLVREIAVRNHFSFGGTFILGLSGGIFSEGFLAKTLVRASELPISQYNDYGYIFGVSFPFTIVISFWHALASILVPILLVYWLYPGNSKQPWFNKKLTVVLAIILLVLGSVALLGKEIVKGTPLQLAVLLGLIVISFLIASRFTQTAVANEKLTKTDLNSKPVWLGMSLFFTYFLLLMFIAGRKLPLILFFAAFFFIIWLYYKILKRNGWLTQKNLILFGIGNYLQNTILATLLAFTIPATLIERVVTGIVAIILLTWLARKIKKSDAPMASIAK